MGTAHRGAAVGVVFAVLAGGFTSLAAAAGLQLFEQSPSALGNAVAGSAATAEDASTIFSNPAGMTYLPGKNVVVGVNAFDVSVKFANNGSTLNAPLSFIPLAGGNGGNGGSLVPVPNLYMSWQLSPQWFIGLGVNAPFGLRTEYDAGWVGRYQGVKSDLTTINVNPSIAWKVNDVVSLGLGLSAQYIDADLTKAVDFGTICAAFGGCGIGLTPQGGDGGQELKANDWGYGANAGAIFQIAPDMRIGFSYRSQVRHNLEGTSTITGTPALLAGSPTFQSTAASAVVTLPESVSMSVFQQYNDQWAMMGDITWTHWSRFKELRVKFANGAPDNVTPENWDNSFRVSLGVTYQANTAWKLRGGIAYDQSPVTDQWRTVRIPDNDRFWVAFGASWAFVPGASLDVGYAHLFVRDADINKSETAAGTVIGTYSLSADVFSLGVSYRF
jgi:long-chain fatty acid transport protein